MPNQDNTNSPEIPDSSNGTNYSKTSNSSNNTSELRETVHDCILIATEHGYRNSESNLDSLKNNMLHYIDDIMEDIDDYTSTLFTQSQVEQMMNELIMPDEISKARDDKLRQSPPWQRNQLRAAQRQSIPLIIEKYKEKL